MSLLSLYSKIQLKIEKAEENLPLPLPRGEYEKGEYKVPSREGVGSEFLKRGINYLQLLFWKTLKIIVRFLALIFGDSSENFLIFTRLNKDSVFVCNNSYCQYKRFQKRVRFYSKTAFAGILICTIVATSVLYLFLPGKRGIKNGDLIGFWLYPKNSI